MIIGEQNYKRVHLNVQVRAKLGKEGKRHLKKYLNEFPVKQTLKQWVDKNGMVNLPLWEFMNIFGSICSIGGGEEIFKNMEILILEEEIKD